jgi:hypothetical protein
VAIRKLLVSYFRPDQLQLDHEEFVEIGIENRHSFRLVIADETGATHGVAVTPAIRESAATPAHAFCH